MTDAPLHATSPEVPAEYALQGFDGVRAYSADPSASAGLQASINITTVATQVRTVSEEAARTSGSASRLSRASTLPSRPAPHEVTPTGSQLLADARNERDTSLFSS